MADWFVSNKQAHELIYRIDAIDEALSCVPANHTQLRLDIVKQLKKVPAVTKQNIISKNGEAKDD